ncbi:hypothetical protein C0995_009117 [Termitomyces sp. Mi166|nr:hypothetical protein C0995_009117 [Termitomyces sp. Mi166\
MAPPDLSKPARSFVSTDLLYFKQAFNHTRSIHDRLHNHPEPLVGKDLEVLIAQILLLLKPSPPVITIKSYTDTRPHPGFWDAICAISLCSQLVERLNTDDNRGYKQPESYHTLCIALGKHFPTFWKWVVCGVCRAWHLDRFPLPNFNTGFLVNALHDFMNDLLQTDQKYGLHQSLFTDGAETFLDLWFLHTQRPELDGLVDVSPDSVVNKWFSEGSGTWSRFPNYGHSASQVAQLVLRRSRKLFQTKQNFLIEKPQHLSQHVEFLIGVAATPALQKHFIAAGAITLYTHMLLHVAEGFGSKDKEPVLRRVLAEQLCTLLTSCFERMQGINWLRRSIETGLLLGIMKCGPRNPAGGRVPSLCELVNILSKYLVYASIIRAVLRSLNKQEVVRAHRRVLKSGSFWVAFTGMRTLAHSRASFFGPRMIKTCKSSQCELKDLNGAFKRCSGCEEAVYCSTECQRRDWTDGGHRSYCKERSRGMEDSENDLSKEEQEFSIFLLAEDLLDNGLITSSPTDFDREKYKAFRRPKILSDHTVFPPRTTVTEDDDGEAGHLTFISKIPYGNESRLAGITRPLNRWPLTHPSQLVAHIEQVSSRLDGLYAR